MSFTPLEYLRHMLVEAEFLVAHTVRPGVRCDTVDAGR